jgi:hypothetical protein
MKKIILTSFFLIAVLSSCTKCYECRIIQTAPQEAGVQFQSTETYVELCGMTNNQLSDYIQQMQSETIVTVQGMKYKGSTRVSCN